MNYNEIVLRENKALVPEIITGIQTIATYLSQNNKELTRRNLVRELNDIVPELKLMDGLIVKSLIREAYLQSEHSPSIQTAISECFIENLGNKLVFDPNRIFTSGFSVSFSNDDPLNLYEFYQKTEILNKNVEKLQAVDSIGKINTLLANIELLVPENILSITGKYKVEAIYNHAGDVYQDYANLIYEYELLKQKNLELFSDFEILRNELKYLREDIVQLLFNIIGNDKMKSYPNIFDFSIVEFLDFENIWKKLNLAFEGIGEKLDVFKGVHEKNMQNIRSAGSIHANNALDKYAKIKKKRGYVSNGEIKGQVAMMALGFAFDAITNIIETRKNAEETVALIKQDIEILKYSLKEDAQIIVEDLLRLGKIFSRLKVTLIPETKKFIDITNKIFDDKIKGAYYEIFKDTTISELTNESKNLKSESRKIVLELEDKKLGIKICENEISRYKDLITELQIEYDYVMDLKPSTPSSIQNFVSFDQAQKNYNKHLDSWERITNPARSNYKFYLNSKKIEEENLIKFDEIVLQLEKRLKETYTQKDFNSIKIKEQIIPSESFKRHLIVLFNEITRFAKSSKNVLESSIDEDLIKTSSKIEVNELFSINEILNQDLSSKNGLTQNDITFLSNKKFQMELKVELIQFVTETILTGALIEKVSEKIKGYLSIEVSNNHLNNELVELNSLLINGLQEEKPNLILEIIESKKNKILNYLDSKKEENPISKIRLDELSYLIENGLIDLYNKLVKISIDNKQNVLFKFITDQKENLSARLTSKLQESSKLNFEQANKLVNLASDVFVSILKNQSINAKTNYLKELNNRLDQEFLKQFDKSIESFKLDIEQNRQEATSIENILNKAENSDDLLDASILINKNADYAISKSEIDDEIDSLLNGGDFNIEL